MSVPGEITLFTSLYSGYWFLYAVMPPSPPGGTADQSLDSPAAALTHFVYCLTAFGHFVRQQLQQFICQRGCDDTNTISVFAL